LLGGFTQSSDGDVSTNKGNYDYWIVKIEERPIIPKPAFSVYPTLGSLDCIFIDASDPMYLPATAIVTQLFFPFGIVVSHECIDVHKLPAGLYLLTITDPKGGVYKTRIRIL